MAKLGDTVAVPKSRPFYVNRTDSLYWDASGRPCDESGRALMDDDIAYKRLETQEEVDLYNKHVIVNI